MTTSVRYEISTTRAWVERREAKGIAVNADEIWQKINTSWPGLTEDEKERVFQGIERRRASTA